MNDSPSQKIYGLYIISSADGLLYDVLFGDCAGHNASENTRIQLASSFASMSHIVKELSPSKECTGISSLEAETFTVEVCSNSQVALPYLNMDIEGCPQVQVFQTLTGIKFLLFVAPGTRQTSEILQAVYELYSDYVMKDPYYELEQRIKSETLKDMLRRKVAEFEVKLVT